MVLPIALAAPVMSGGGVEFWNKPCLKAYKDWQSKPGHKAFAVSNTALDNGGQTCGYSWGHPSKAAAEKAALKPCQRGKFSSTCWISASE